MKVLSSVDVLLLAEVYPAGEQPIVAADGRTLARTIRVAGKVDPVFVADIADMPAVILNVVEDGEWKRLWGAWLRLTKNEYHAGWVESMEPTNTRPPLTPEQDRAMLGKYAYQKDEVRKPAPEPPRDDTWEVWPDETDQSWQFINL